MKHDKQNNDSYADILLLPHHISDTRPRMPVEIRAAQFSPFAALTGYDAAVAECARLTEEYREIDEGVKEELDRKLNIMRRMLQSESAVHESVITITYFRPDSVKEGGEYLQISGCVTNISEQTRTLVLDNDKEIAMEHICDIQGEIFDEWGL